MSLKQQMMTREEALVFLNDTSRVPEGRINMKFLEFMSAWCKFESDWDVPVQLLAQSVRYTPPEVLEKFKSSTINAVVKHFGFEPDLLGDIITRWR